MTNLPVWTVKKLPRYFASKLQPESLRYPYVTICEGQVLVVAQYDNMHGPLDVGSLAGHV